MKRASLPYLAAGFLVLLFGAAYGLLPSFRAETDALARLLARADATPLREYLLGFGAWAPLVSAVLQLVTSIVAPLPSFVVTFVNALVFGFWWGALLTFVTALAASLVCFALARALGRPVVERLAGRSSIAAFDGWFARHGAAAVLVARLVPFMNPDVVSYAAGLTALRRRTFLAAVALGSLPSTLVYSYLGARGVTALGWFLVPLVALGFLTFLGAYLRARRAAPATTAPTPGAPPHAERTG